MLCCKQEWLQHAGMAGTRDAKGRSDGGDEGCGELPEEAEEMFAVFCIHDSYEVFRL